MIKAVVLDFDGVLYFESDLFSRRFSKDFDMPLSEIEDFFHRHFQECLEGKKDMKEVLKLYIRKWEWKKGINALLEYWFDDGTANQEMLEVVKQLRNRNIKLVLCTNNEKYRMDYMIRKLSLDKLFDFIIASHEIGATKPDEKVFRFIIGILGLEPHEMVFFDNDTQHVKAAANAGMQAFVFKGMEDFRKIVDILIRK